MHFNKTYTQEYTPSFLKAEKKEPESYGPFAGSNRTPPKVMEKKDNKHGRTPTKNRTVAGTEKTKTSTMSKSPEQEDKKLFRSLN